MPWSGRSLALLGVSISVLGWSCSNVISKVITTSGLVVSFYRLWLAIPLLWLFPLVSPAVRRRLDRDWLQASLVGGGLFAIHQVFFFSSLKLTSVANVATLGALQPALVLLVAGRWFGEGTSTRAVVWTLIALAGAGMVVRGSTSSAAWSLYGDGMAAANLFAFTAYFLASKEIRGRVPALEYVIGLTTVAGLWVGLAVWVTGQSITSPVGADWAWLFFMALGPGTLGHFLMNWAHPHLPALVVSLLLLAVPVLSSVLAAMVLGEALNLWHGAGGVVALGAIARLLRETAPRGQVTPA